LCPDHREILDWMRGLPQPVAVAYEAGPTGFGSARTLDAAGFSCLVAAPSKLIRPPEIELKRDRSWDVAGLGFATKLVDDLAVHLGGKIHAPCNHGGEQRVGCWGDCLRDRQ
jgi:hypothetical protein